MKTNHGSVVPPAQGADEPACHCGFAKPVPGPHHLASCGMYESGDRSDMLAPAVPQGAAAEPTREPCEWCLNMPCATPADCQCAPGLMLIIDALATAGFEDAGEWGAGASDAAECAERIATALAALRQSLASAEAREAKLLANRERYLAACKLGANALAEAFTRGHEKYRSGGAEALRQLAADLAALSPSPSEPGDTNVPS